MGADFANEETKTINQGLSCMYNSAENCPYWLERIYADETAH